MTGWRDLKLRAIALFIWSTEFSHFHFAPFRQSKSISKKNRNILLRIWLISLKIWWPDEKCSCPKVIHSSEMWLASNALPFGQWKKKYDWIVDSLLVKNNIAYYISQVIVLLLKKYTRNSLYNTYCVLCAKNFALPYFRTLSDSMQRSHYSQAMH